MSPRDDLAPSPSELHAPAPTGGAGSTGALGALQRSPLVRTTLTSFFVLAMLAAAHLFMVVINAVEARVESPDPAAGEVARLFTDRPLAEELEMAIRKSDDPAEIAVYGRALAAARHGEPVVLHTLPNTGFIVWAMLWLNVAGLFLIWLTSRLRSDAAQSILGIFGGNLLWTGGIEYGLMVASRSLGIGKAVAVVDGQLVAIYGEYVLLKYTWGALALVVAYLLFLDSSRCPLFLWWRKNVPTMRGPVVSGRITNYGPRSAFQYTTTVWALYLLLLWAYDERVFGVYSPFTKMVLLGSVGATVYCMWRLWQQPGWGPAVRYAVAAVCIAWTPLEIFAKWGVMKEPWLLLEPHTAILFFGGLGLGTWALWRAQRRRAVVACPHLAAASAAARPVAVGPGRSEERARVAPGAAA